MKSIIDYLGKLERQITRFSLQVILMVFGAKAAGTYLSYSPFVRRTQARILWLHEQIRSRSGREAADRFVIDYLSARPRLQDYGIALVGTGAHRPSSERVAAALPRLLAVAGQREDASISLASALLERGDVELALELVAEQQGKARSKSSVDWPSLLRSLSPRHLYETTATASSTIGSPEHLRPGPSKNRLIILDEELSPAAIKSLAAGADKITLLQYRDLYGRIDLRAVQAEIPECQIAVEHGRSRVDRFHRRYFDIHQETLQTAELLSKSFVKNAPWVGEFISDVQGFANDLTLELSDMLFFKALRLESVYQAALDPAFDSVIVSFGDGFELFRLFYSDSALWQDSRIKGCCRSRKIKTVSKFASRLADMQRRATVGSDAPTLAHIASLQEQEEALPPVPPETVRRYLEQSATPAKYASKTRLPGRKTIGYVANDTRAYVASSIQLATHLQGHFNVDVILTQGNPANLLKNIETAQNDPYLPQETKGQRPGLVKVGAAAPGATATKAFSDVFLLAVGDTVREQFATIGRDVVVRAALDFLLTEGLSRAVLHTMGNVRAIATHLAEQSYAAIAISPIRSARNAQFATLGRENRVPTLAVEPHCLNSAYCRYGTVLSDYAAVYSDYYAQEYDRYFGIPKERCYTFGSPRVLRPIDYDPIAARKDARRKIGLHPGDPPIIAVPTQPMPAEHILAVWRMIIRAAKALDMPVRVILKAHPEEGPGHVGRYRQIIAEEEATDLCYVADVDIKDLLIASELVLTAYSVTALEAVVLERNVAIVGQEGVTYPVEYDKILGIPLCLTEKETLETIREALTLHGSAKSGAQQFKAANPHLFDNSTFDRLKEIVEDIIAKGPENIRRRQELPASLFVTAPFREYLV
ncbi:MAG: hypothetical protein CTR54_03785 [Rhizobium sp.]|nr:MAG: hypothetical protein CTR54_03785 [Rhizobium sp.]